MPPDLISFPFLAASGKDTKFHRLEHSRIQIKELGKVNIWSLALVTLQHYFFEMEALVGQEKKARGSWCTQAEPSLVPLL